MSAPQAQNSMLLGHAQCTMYHIPEFQAANMYTIDVKTSSSCFCSSKTMRCAQTGCLFHNVILLTGGTKQFDIDMDPEAQSVEFANSISYWGIDYINTGRFCQL